MFNRLVREDPDTLYFDSIPLLWQMQQCPADVKAVVGGWLSDESTPANRLMAASWLMVQDRKRALSVLRQLGKEPSKKVSSLAVAQLWRAEMVTLKESRLEWWTEQLSETPAALRAGSYFLLGQSHARFNQADQATLALLRVPTLFPDDVVLGQKCFGKAAEILLKQGHNEEAANVYRQSIKLAASTTAGKQASQRLSELTN
jgi:tetratricopeptide (TPR) repeat protein